LTGKAAVVVSVSKNTPPEVSAGADTYVYVPADFITLSATATDAENNIDTYNWRQISGPTHEIIQTPDSYRNSTTLFYLNTISRLKKGEYSFELTVTDIGGLSGKDSVNFIVFDAADVGTNQKIFKDLQWSCPWWGCELSIENIFSHIPRNVPIKVKIRPAGSSIWIEVPHESIWTTEVNPLPIYGFGIWEERFYVYADYFDERKWDVMIVY
jgi:hypothetical protein